MEEEWKKLEKIKEMINNWEALENSLADKRDKHRKFANIIKLDYVILESVYKTYEPNLKIVCYTFMEQLVKKFVYLILERGKNSKVIDQFIETQLNPYKFSPDIKIKEIKKIIKRYIPDINEFELMWKYVEERDVADAYNNLIQGRHQYAHYGFETKYPLDINQYSKIVKLLEYFLEEFEMLCVDLNNRLKINKLIEEISSAIKEINKDSNTLKYIKIKIGKIKEDSKQLIKILKLKNLKSEIYKNISEKLENLSKIDLRIKKEEILKILSDNKFN